VTGLDASRGLLMAGHTAIAAGLVQGDARRLPFAEESFDGVWACASLLHVPKDDVKAALAEAFRVLRHGGVLFTSMSEGRQNDAIPLNSDGLAERLYFYHSGEGWADAVKSAGFVLLDHEVRREGSNFNPGSTGWIETFARKP
jgi:ubiquinone/menaquinone biosynthesis C-methylase UbiE